MIDVKQVYDFAIKWEDKFRNQNINYVELVDHFMADDCERLHFEMDCGNAFEEVYGNAFNNFEKLYEIKDEITDIKLLGSAIYSKWRYFNHWAYDAAEILKTENRSWFIIALCRLSKLAGEDPFIFTGMPKKISIVSNSMGYGPCPKPDDIVKPTSVVETTEPSTKKDDIIIDEPVIEEPTEVVTENKEYNLGESVNIKDNSYIYTNSYDATDSTNKCTPYYNGSYDREVMGVTYELDGNLYTIYRDDMNASEKVNELISKGAKQTAVLVVRSDLVNTGDYEGYYNIDSIKRVRTR